MHRRLAVSLGLFTATLFTGCSSEPEPRPLGSDQFQRRDDRGGAIVSGPRVPEQTGDVAAPTPTHNPANTAAINAGGTSAATPTNPPSADSMQFVAQQVKPVIPTTLPTDAAAPATATPVSYAVGQYVSVGAIIAEVNGTPIYADDVVRAIAPVLAAQAKDLDEGHFRSLATNEINRQVDDMIRAEVAFAAADRNTTSEDKDLASKATERWRDRLKTDNKGSMEEVRRKFREQGQTYDDVAKEQYRRNLVIVFYQKKLFPRIQVTADDLRRYYDRNRDSQFTQHDAITFRLIKITPEAMGSDTLAQKKAAELAARVNRGEDFATIAGETNHDSMLLRNKGLTGPIDRGAYSLENVETALWAINAGENTPVISDHGAYYLAHLESKTVGRVAPFEENAVQMKMFDALRGEQFSGMRRDFENQLRRESVVAKNDATYATALAMAMQNYAKWHQQ